MNKLKWGLRIITICCVILPLLFTILAYQNNMKDLIIPPQITSAMSGNSQTIQEISPDFRNMLSIEPTFNDDFQFNSENRTFSFSLNLTSPLDTLVTCNSLNLTLTDENEVVLGTINLGNPTTLVPDKNSTIPIEGELSQEFVTHLQNSGIDLTDPNFNPEDPEVGLDITNIHFTNVNIDVGGMQIHVDELNPYELFESQEFSSTEGQ